MKREYHYYERIKPPVKAYAVNSFDDLKNPPNEFGDFIDIDGDKYSVKNVFRKKEIKKHDFPLYLVIENGFCSAITKGSFEHYYRRIKH